MQIVHKLRFNSNNSENDDGISTEHTSAQCPFRKMKSKVKSLLKWRVVPSFIGCAYICCLCLFFCCCCWLFRHSYTFLNCLSGGFPLYYIFIFFDVVHSLARTISDTFLLFCLFVSSWSNFQRSCMQYRLNFVWTAGYYIRRVTGCICASFVYPHQYAPTVVAKEEEEVVEKMPPNHIIVKWLLRMCFFCFVLFLRKICEHFERFVERCECMFISCESALAF